MTVEETLEFFLRFRGVEDRERIINQTLADYDLKTCANIVAERLSFNQRKKLSIAVVLLSDAKIILLDEPSTGLDVVNKRLIWAKIKEAKPGKIIVVVSQDMQAAEVLGDRIGYIQKGSLKKCGSYQFFDKLYD